MTERRDELAKQIAKIIITDAGGTNAIFCANVILDFLKENPILTKEVLND